MTDPEPRPAVDPWEHATEPDPWIDGLPPLEPSPYPAQPVSGSPVSGSPVSGSPVSGSPVSGSPVSGSPVSGSPVPGSGQYMPGQASVPAAYQGTTAQAQAGPPVYSTPPGHPYQQHFPPPPGPRGSGRTVAIVLTILAVALIAVGVVFVPKWINQPSGGNTAGQTTGPTVTTTTTTPAVPASTFAGTPADTSDFGNGADGINLPAAVAVPGFSQATVAGNLTKIKATIVAGRLDPKMVVNRDPSTLLALLSPRSRAEATGHFATGKAFPYATRLATGTRLTDDPIKVRGRMTLAAGTTNDGIRAMRITADFIWVYPVAAQRSGAGANLIVVRDQVIWTVYDAGQVDRDSEGVWIEHATAMGSNVDCTVVQNDQVTLPAVSVPEAQTEASPAYNLDASLEGVKFVCN
jgi:hypothetical protein